MADNDKIELLENAPEEDYGNSEETISEKRLKEIEVKLKDEELAGRKQDRRLREIFGEKIFDFVSLYMFGVFFILLLTGLPCAFYLSDAVLITILGTTTANVIGVLIIVTTYYFNKSKSQR